MNCREFCLVAVFAAGLSAATAAVSQPAPGNTASRPPPPSEFVILGTSSGPNSEATRAQPANALLVQGQLYLVDAGDGAVAQLAKAGLRLPAVRAVFLSHLHFDHTAGMFAVLGLRMQLEQRGRLQVFGPPGTKALVDGLLAAAAPAMRAGYGIPGQTWSADIEVVELTDGATVPLDGFEVVVVENSHFSLPDGDAGAPEGVSLSYRFNLPDRAIVYTGDTGPSEALVALARGADLLVSEMVDSDRVLAQMGLGAARAGGAPAAPPVPAGAAAAAGGFAWHMRAHHMTPIQVGELAQTAGAGRLVVTHYGPNPMNPEQAQAYLDAIGESYSGDAHLALDLERF